MTTYLMKTLKVSILVMSSLSVCTLANAQSATVGTSINLNLGKDVRAAHESRGNLNLDKGKVVASGAVADGLRVGDSQFQSGVHGAVSVPSDLVSRALRK